MTDEPVYSVLNGKPNYTCACIFYGGGEFESWKTLRETSCPGSFLVQTNDGSSFSGVCFVDATAQGYANCSDVEMGGPPDYNNGVGGTCGDFSCSNTAGYTNTPCP